MGPRIQPSIKLDATPLPRIGFTHYWGHLLPETLKIHVCIPLIIYSILTLCIPETPKRVLLQTVKNHMKCSIHAFHQELQCL